MSTPANGIFSGLFASVGSEVASSPQVQAAADQATQGFYAIAGELFIIIVLLTLMLARMWRRG